MPSESEPKRFRIAFSFAGEKRDFVERVARILADRFGEEAILYDKFHEAEFARYDLGIHLPKLYSEQSSLVVSVLSSNYDAKRWCGLEWGHIYGLLNKPDRDRVLPSRFDYASADGLSPSAGFIELDRKTPAQFAELILERLAINENLPKEHYTKPATPPASVLKTDIPHNLPTLQPFFGREDELKKIADALDPDSRTWGALIDGPGGMGKTSLAVRAAYNAPPDVFISLKSRELDDDGVRDLSGLILSGLAEHFGELARELGLDDLAKAPEDQRQRLLLDALRGTQTLLVLDHLESLTKLERDHLFTFVKKLPAGCKAILTSRGRIGSGAEELILEALSQEAALATLAELATHNPILARTSEAERLVLHRETAGKPLLLRWTAGQLGRGHCLTFTDALDFICSCPKGNDPLEFIFGDLVHDLDAAETQALSSLTYFSLPASVEHVATLASLSVQDTDRALRKLTVRSLAVPTDEYKTFTLVAMVADFLRKNKPEVVAETGNRLENYAFGMVIENGYQKHDRFPVLEAAWLSVAPALPRFLNGPNDRLQTVCDALRLFLNCAGRWDELLALASDAELRAVAARDLLNAGRRACDAGWVHSQRGKSADVLTCADRAEAYSREAESGAHARATAHRLRGTGHQMAGDFVAAIAAYHESVDLLRNLDPESGDVAFGLNALADAKQLMGQFESAERDYHEALIIARRIDDFEGAASYTGNLAGLLLAREEWTRAEALAREALLLAERVGRQQLVAANCHHLAWALMQLGKTAEALPYSRRALEIFTRLGVAADTESARATLRECEKLTSCLYIDSIELRNIRCFVSLSINLRDCNEASLSSIILGDNAAGKSTLLRCIAIGMSNEPDATALLASIPGAFIREGADEGQIRIVLRRADGSDFFSVTTRIVRVEGAGGPGESARQVIVPKANFPRGDIFVCGYGTSRVPSGTASYDTYSPRTAVAALFDERASLWNPEVALLRRPTDLRAEMERRLLRILMLDAAEDAIISSEGQPTVRGPWGAVSFEVLSDGYRSTSQWLLDFMAWAILADRFGGPTGVRGILLIDELEQHLHPRWQRHIMQRLSRQLPGTQIIATTHTPLIAGGIVDISPSTVWRVATSEDDRSASIKELNKEELRGKRADQILASDAFGLITSRSPGSVGDAERYAELANRVGNSSVEEEFEKLAARMSANSVFGETEYERSVKEAIAETLEHRLKQLPSEPLGFELKRQLRELFKEADAP